MSFLRYSRDEPIDNEAPRRVYARVDQVESTDDGDVLLLDSVDADWFDAIGEESPWFGDPRVAEEIDRRISVVELVLPGARWRSERLAKVDWLELRFEPRDAYGLPDPHLPALHLPVRHYLNLFSPPTERLVEQMTAVSAETEIVLDKATGMDPLPDASVADIQGALATVGGEQAAAVYDVGQGNCTAFLRDGFPTLYFDIGGGVMRHRDSFPTALNRFCFTGEPSVILSHWDWDHWSSARRDTTALGTTWVVPRQRIGPTHCAFLSDLLRHGTVHVWPGDLDQLQVAELRVERCTGYASDRNASGLAMVFERSGADSDERMLFPADCGYDFIPSGRLDYTSVVVAHHGGRTKSTFVPAISGSPESRIVYSYGIPNYYEHPFQAVTDAFAKTGVPVLRTIDRDPASGLGHVHLYWDQAQQDAGPPCGGSHCSLTCEQR